MPRKGAPESPPAASSPRQRFEFGRAQRKVIEYETLLARNRGGAFDRPPYCLVIVMA